MPWMDAAPLAGRDESRPYGTRKKFLMPWMDVAPLAGRDEEIAPSGQGGNS